MLQKMNVIRGVRLIVLSALLLAIPCAGQLPTFSSGVGPAKSVQAGTLAGIPALCAIADIFFATDQAAGTELRLCDSLNHWSALPSAGTGTVTNTGGALTADLPMFGAGGNDSKVGTKTGTGNVAVMQASPTLTTPTIADFTNATHTHANAAGGGQIPSTSVTGLAASATTNALNASNISSGALGLARGGTNADLSGTGGVSQVLKQTSVGGAVTVAQLAVADLSDTKTGSGNLVLATSPTINTPTIADFTNANHTHLNAAGGGVITSVNKMAVTAPATSSTLAVADGKTLTASNTLTFTGTDGSAAAFGAGGTVMYTNTGVTASQLPNPSASTLGGVESFAAVTNQWINAISTSGVPSSTQPTLDQLANPAAGITWTFPATNLLVLTGTAPGSQAGAGTAEGTFLTITSPAGGATTGSATTGGTGGAVSIATGAGGSGAGGTNANGGAGGLLVIGTGAGGALSGSGVVGNPGAIAIQQAGTTVFSVAGSTRVTTVNAGAVTATTALIGGGDSVSAAQTQGLALVRGGNVTSGATTSSIGGAVSIQGGDNQSTATTGTITGGNATIRPGQVTAGAGATQTNGLLLIQQAFVKGATYTANNLGYVSAAPASGAGAGNATVSDCTSAAGNCQQFVGANVTASGNASTTQTHGVVTVASNASAQWAASDYVCVDPANAAKFISGSTIGCYGTAMAGIALGDSASVATHPMLIQPRNPMTARAITTSAYTNATTTFSTVTGGNTLQFAIQASTNYAITCQILWQGSATTTGPKFQWTGPASPTAVAAAAHMPITTSTYLDATAVAFSGAMADTGTITATTNFLSTLTLGVVNGANAGTAILQAAANGAGTLTIQPGSFCAMQ